MVQSDTNSSTIYTSSHQNTEDQHHNALPLVMYSEQESSTHYERLSMDTTLDQPLEHHQSHHDNESLLDILKETIVKKDDLIHQLTEDKNVLDQKSSQQSLLITTLNQQSTESFTEKQLLNQKVEDMSQLINTLNQQKINDASTNGYLLIQASLSQNVTSFHSYKILITLHGLLGRNHETQVKIEISRGKLSSNGTRKALHKTGQFVNH